MKFTQEDLKQLIKEEMAKLYEDAIEDSTEEEAAEAKELAAERPMEEDKHKGEGSMARNQLARTGEIAHMLEKMIGDDTNLEEWVESKITKAQDYLSSVLNHLSVEDQVDVGDAARDMKAQAAVMNFGPLEENLQSDFTMAAKYAGDPAYAKHGFIVDAIENLMKADEKDLGFVKVPIAQTLQRQVDDIENLKFEVEDEGLFAVFNLDGEEKKMLLGDRGRRKRRGARGPQTRSRSGARIAGSKKPPGRKY
jgi:predicted RNA-binding protein Jag